MKVKRSPLLPGPSPPPMAAFFRAQRVVRMYLACNEHDVRPSLAAQGPDQVLHFLRQQAPLSQGSPPPRSVEVRRPARHRACRCQLCRVERNYEAGGCACDGSEVLPLPQPRCCTQRNAGSRPGGLEQDLSEILRGVGAGRLGRSAAPQFRPARDISVHCLES